MNIVDRELKSGRFYFRLSETERIILEELRKEGGYTSTSELIRVLIQKEYYEYKKNKLKGEQVAF